MVDDDTTEAKFSLLFCFSATTALLPVAVTDDEDGGEGEKEEPPAPDNDSRIRCLILLLLLLSRRRSVSGFLWWGEKAEEDDDDEVGDVFDRFSVFVGLVVLPLVLLLLLLLTPSRFSLAQLAQEERYAVARLEAADKVVCAVERSGARGTGEWIGFSLVVQDEEGFMIREQRHTFRWFV